MNTTTIILLLQLALNLLTSVYTNPAATDFQKQQALGFANQTVILATNAVTQIDAPQHQASLPSTSASISIPSAEITSANTVTTAAPVKMCWWDTEISQVHPDGGYWVDCNSQIYICSRKTWHSYYDKYIRIVEPCVSGAQP